MVATVHPLATEVGLDTLARGGNAIDAAVAAALMLGVVDNHNSGLGGGCLILLRLADGKLVAIDGRETAPGAATGQMFVRDGRARTHLSQAGPLAPAVPGALAAYAMAIRNHGRLSLSQLILPAADRAEMGFRIDRVYAEAIREIEAQGIDQFPDLKRTIWKSNGEPVREGEMLKQPDLAASYRAIAAEGPEWFYRGPFARRVAEWMSAHGGLLSEQDFDGYRARAREPIVSTYRDYEIVGFPPPSSGGVHVAQVLNILEHYDLAAIQRNNPGLATHLILEALKLALADRAYWLGDSDFVDVPRGLLSKEYAGQLAARIRLDRVIDVTGHGTPTDWQDNLFGKHTTHIAVVDQQGNWAAVTATLNTEFGSKVVIPGTGIVLNNEMDDFSVQAGVPNAYQLIGNANNAIEPGKRPLSSMSPTIVLKDGQPVLTIGAAGGPRIITQVVLTIVRHLDYGLPLPEAVAAPRFHHQWSPRTTFVEESLAAQTRRKLVELGHVVKPLRNPGVTQAIARLADGTLVGVHDPRVPGKAAGLPVR
jgi:gamma-glutamyltranspeptidase/glutathione hydrolase